MQMVFGVDNSPRIHRHEFFSERYPIPRRLTYSVSDGVVNQQDITGRESRAGVIREVEVEVLVDLEMAKSLKAWLEEHIGYLEDRLRVQPEKEG